jgi:hypothetical protein
MLVHIPSSNVLVISSTFLVCTLPSCIVGFISLPFPSCLSPFLVCHPSLWSIAILSPSSSCPIVFSSVVHHVQAIIFPVPYLSPWRWSVTIIGTYFTLFVCHHSRTSIPCLSVTILGLVPLSVHLHSQTYSIPRWPTAIQTYSTLCRSITVLRLVPHLLSWSSPCHSFATCLNRVAVVHGLLGMSPFTTSTNTKAD